MSEEDVIQQTTAEQIAAQSTVGASLWRLAEGGRIVGFSVAVLGPFVVAAIWFTDILRSQVARDEFPNALKEWYFYVGLALINIVIGLFSAKIAERVEVKIEARFLKRFRGPESATNQAVNPSRR